MQHVEKVIFTDVDQSFMYSVRQQLPAMRLQVSKKNVVMVEATCQDIRQFKIPNCAYVSPANSFLYFDGGIDLYYGKMFPLLQRDAQQYMLKYPYRLKNRPILPVGSALVVPVKHKEVSNNYIVATPTMTEPQVLEGEEVRYVYWSVLAMLIVVHKYNTHCQADQRIKTIIIPGMGTGCGDVSYGDSVKLILEAFADFLKRENISDEAPDDPNLFLSDRTVKVDGN